MQLVVGSGPIGSAVARRLADAGWPVVVVTRSGSGPDGVEHVAADAGDADRMAQLATGAEAIYNCANPPYHRWPTDWPPIARSLLPAAERSGAGHCFQPLRLRSGTAGGPCNGLRPAASDD